MRRATSGGPSNRRRRRRFGCPPTLRARPRAAGDDRHRRAARVRSISVNARFIVAGIAAAGRRSALFGLIAGALVTPAIAVGGCTSTGSRGETALVVGRAGDAIGL